MIVWCEIFESHKLVFMVADPEHICILTYSVGTSKKTTCFIWTMVDLCFASNYEEHRYRPPNLLCSQPAWCSATLSRGSPRCRALEHGWNHPSYWRGKPMCWPSLAPRGRVVDSSRYGLDDCWSHCEKAGLAPNGRDGAGRRSQRMWRQAMKSKTTWLARSELSY